MIPRDKLYRVTKPLKQCGVSFSVGGSGLLYAHGLVDSVNDWDITTDHPFSDIVGALKAENWSLKPKTETFDSEYVVLLPEFNTEIIGSFRIITATGVCEIPSFISSWWDEDIPIASPEAWLVAYRLMCRDDKANLLHQFIETNGVNRDIARHMLNQPLSPSLKAEVDALFVSS